MRGSGLNAAMMIGALAGIGVIDPFGNRNSGKWDDPLDGIDIDAEHELIQQKKSTLSANMRRRVEVRFERNHKQQGETHDGK